MATRSVAWRRQCPEELKSCLDEASRITLYIVHQVGPTGFILKDETTRKKIKVLLGECHMCTCPTFKKSHELCIHILWVLLKKFRIPCSNAVVWQLGLIEREINEILRGYLSRQSPTPSRKKTHSSTRPDQIPQREIGPDDVCPICQDDLLGSARAAITYCRFSCGKSVHVKCMKIWSEHQNCTGEKAIRCPLCREEFGSILSLAKTGVSRLTGMEQQSRHLGTSCSSCHVCPVVGKCYKCCFCVEYYLCHACYSNQIHAAHPFHFRQHCDQSWRAVPRPSLSSVSFVSPSQSPTFPPTLVNTLQSRSLTESDYDILLGLDDPQSLSDHPTAPRGANQRPRPSREGVSERMIASLRVEPLDGNHPLVVGGACCSLCQRGYVRGDWIKKLPCKHKFHRSCLDEWLHASHTTCPVDHQPLWDTPTRRTRHAPKPPEGPPPSLSSQRFLAPLVRAGLLRGVAGQSHDPRADGVEIGIWGRGIATDAAIVPKNSKRVTRKKARRLRPRDCQMTQCEDVSSPHTNASPTHSTSLPAPPLQDPAPPTMAGYNATPLDLEPHRTTSLPIIDNPSDALPRRSHSSPLHRNPLVTTTLVPRPLVPLLNATPSQLLGDQRTSVAMEHGFVCGVGGVGVASRKISCNGGRVRKGLIVAARAKGLRESFLESADRSLQISRFKLPHPLSLTLAPRI